MRRSEIDAITVAYLNATSARLFAWSARPPSVTAPSLTLARDTMRSDDRSLSVIFAILEGTKARLLI